MHLEVTQVMSQGGAPYHREASPVPLAFPGKAWARLTSGGLGGSEAALQTLTDRQRS